MPTLIITESITNKSGDGYNCSDVNECESSPCDMNASCSNSEGSFSCECNSGYQGSGFMCTDVNECATRLGLFKSHVKVQHLKVLYEKCRNIICY